MLGCRPAAKVSAPRAAGGALLAAGIDAVATVVGRVGHVARIDRHAYRAPLAVEQDVDGPFKQGITLEIVWEELAARRETRFRTGERVLVTLTALPSGSLWMNRFPPRLRSERLLSVAANGEAFLRDPDQATIVALAEYLHIPAAQRRSAVAVQALSNLAFRAAAPVALAAAVELSALTDLSAHAGVPATELLKATIADPTRPTGVRRTLLQLAARQQMTALRPVIETLSQISSPLRADAVEALAAIDHGLPSDRAIDLLRSSDDRLRAAAIRAARGDTLREPIIALLHDDPSPLVRSAAVEALAADRGLAALPLLLAALEDGNPQVRESAARAIGAVGTEAAAAVEQLGMSASPNAAQGAILALVELGPAGTSGLQKISAEHSDPQVRRLARLALGRPQSDH